METKRLQFVVGKGGVGKSTVSTALALAAANSGLRTLLVELGGPGGCARLLGAKPLEANEPVEAVENLWLTYIEGESALAEYLALVVPVKRLLKTVFQSPVYRAFVAAAPGLKELMTVGKIWFEATREERGLPYWDRIIVDAGASGHSLQYLEMPRAAAETFSSGLVHREAERVAALLADVEVTAVHVVATPEDMPLVEAAEILDSLQRLCLPLGGVFVNRCRPPAPPAVDEVILALQATTGSSDEVAFAKAVAETAAAARAWEAVQERGIATLEQKISGVSAGAPSFATRLERLPLLSVEEFSSRELGELADLVSIFGREAP
jgi:anion-transporting  ArsA/GET3 family ATPase